MTAAIVTQAVPLALITVLAWLMPSLTSDTLAFGVRIPSERAGAEVIERARRSYRWHVGVFGIAVTALATAAGVESGVPWLPTLAVALLLAGVWLLYLRAHHAIARTKQAQAWYEDRPQGVSVDTDLRVAPPGFPWPWLAPAMAVIAATVAIGALRYPHLPSTLVTHYGDDGIPDGRSPTTMISAFSLVFVQLVLTALIAGTGAWTARARPDLDAERPRASAAAHRVYVRRMACSLLMLAALIDVSLLFESTIAWGMLEPRGAHLAITFLPIALGVAQLVIVALRAGQGGSRLMPASPGRTSGLVNRDDDRYWTGGLIYCNRRDHAILVPKRFGIGWTLNFGNPLSWVVVCVLIAFGVVAHLTKFG